MLYYEVVFLFYSNRVKLPLPLLLWNSQSAVHSMEEMWNSMLQGLSQYQGPKDQEFITGGFTSDHCRILSVILNLCHVVLSPARNCTRQTCLEPVEHFC